METSRLIIRPFEVTDAPAFFKLSLDAGFISFLITDYRQSDVQSAQSWIKTARATNEASGLGKWAVVEKQTGELIGMGGLTPWQWEGEDLVDITYRLKSATQGKGLGMELARALMERGSQLPLTATITPDNIPSIKLTEKLGFRFEKQILLLGVVTNLYRFAK